MSCEIVKGKHAIVKYSSDVNLSEDAIKIRRDFFEDENSIITDSLDLDDTASRFYSRLSIAYSNQKQMMQEIQSYLQLHPDD